MITKFRTATDDPKVVHWNQSHHPYSVDLTFTLLGGSHEITIRQIDNGVARPLNDAGYHIIPRGIAHPYYLVEKAADGVTPLLLKDPHRPPSAYDGNVRIYTGSGRNLPREYHCV